MKKVFNSFLIILVLSMYFMPVTKVYAATTVTTGTVKINNLEVRSSVNGDVIKSVTALFDGINIREEADATSADGDPAATIVTKSLTGEKFIFLENKGTVLNSGCSKDWYKVKDIHDLSTGYICTGLDTANEWVTAPVNKTISTGYKFTITETIAGTTENACDSSWYKFNTSDSSTGFGYVCGGTNNASVTVTTETIDIASQFPSDYAAKLLELQKLHPNWVFKPRQTNLEFNNVIENQDILQKALIQTNYDGYRSTVSGSYNWLTNTWTKFDSGWGYAAATDTIKYYVDPWNFLNEKDIFMFKKETYSDSALSDNDITNLISSMFNGTWFETVLPNYADVILASSKKYNVDPISIASRIRQEMGAGVYNTSTLTRAAYGGAFTYNSINYSGIYNFFNIGAYQSGEYSAVTYGLAFAGGLRTNSDYNATYGMPWNTPEKAIDGGIKWISSGYIAKGQDTAYYQKWNVVGYLKDLSGNYVLDSSGNKIGYEYFTHQYMTNIEAPKQEASSAYNAFLANNIIDQPLVFEIPIYTNMPALTKMPHIGNPNNLLSSLKIDGELLTNFNASTSIYSKNISQLASSVNIAATSISGKASVIGIGTVATTNTTTTVNVVVTAENGNKKTYTITLNKVGDITINDVLTKLALTEDETFLRDIKTSTTVKSFTDKIYAEVVSAVVTVKDVNDKLKDQAKILGTGDTIIITIGPETKTFTNVVKGDLNGDGGISILDLLRIQKLILEKDSYALSEPFKKAGDINGDSNVTLLDLLRVQKHILGDYTIE